MTSDVITHNRVARLAADLTPAAFVCLVTYDADESEVRVASVSGTHTPLFPQVNSSARRAKVGWTPSITVGATANAALTEVFHDKKSVGASVSSFFDGVIETLLINSTFAPFADHWCLAAPIVIDDEIYAALLFVAAEQFSKPQEASCLDFAEECRSSVAGLFEEQRLNVEIEQMTDRLRHIQTNDPLGLTQRNGARSNGPRSFGDIRLSLDTQTARRGNRELNLTRREFDLLDTFLRSPGIALSRIQNGSRVWIERNGINSNVLNVTVKNLRGKLEAEGEPRVIHALRAYGYVLKA